MPATSTRVTTCGGEEVALPEPHEGDVLALLRMGSYNRSMHIDHRLRPPAGTVAFGDRV